MRKRHDNKRDKDRLKRLHYCASNIITKSLLSEEHPNDVQFPTAKNKTMGFYVAYHINLPLNLINELSTERI